jgi:hypothetical protein
MRITTVISSCQVPNACQSLDGSFSMSSKLVIRFDESEDIKLFYR